MLILLKKIIIFICKLITYSKSRIPFVKSRSLMACNSLYTPVFPAFKERNSNRDLLTI